MSEPIVDLNNQDLKIGSRSFEYTDQEMFALATGDRNPMHLDENFARKTQAGELVVHGMHVLLWALDSFASTSKETGVIYPTEVSILKYKFHKFVIVGKTVDVFVEKFTETVVRLTVKSEDYVMVTISLLSKTPKETSPLEPESLELVELGDQPDVVKAEALENLSGRIEYRADARKLLGTYPNLDFLKISENVIALGMSSTLVGMVSPGLNSIYVEGTLQISDQNASDDFLYTVTSFDERFNLVEMSVQSAGVTGKVTAFLRAELTIAPNLATVAPYVEPQQWAARRVLIVGGSRGLGAVTAALLAAGGAKVTVTYHRSAEEAALLANGLIGAAEPVDHLQIDVTGNLDGLKGLEIDDLYYFATPKIFRQNVKVFDADLFDEFNSVYISGFEKTLSALLETNAALNVLYPSSVAIDERPTGMTEYAMSKIAGEFLCKDLVASNNKLKIDAPRLPRTLTDQTATVPPAPAENPIDVILPLLFKA